MLLFVNYTRNAMHKQIMTIRRIVLTDSTNFIPYVERVSKSWCLIGSQAL